MWDESYLQRTILQMVNVVNVTEISTKLARYKWLFWQATELVLLLSQLALIVQGSTPVLCISKLKSEEGCQNTIEC